MNPPCNRLRISTPPALWGRLEAPITATEPGRNSPWSVLTREDFLWYFRQLKAANFTGPVSVHYEFPFSGVDRGARELQGITRKEVLQVLRQNQQVLREMMQEAALL